MEVIAKTTPVKLILIAEWVLGILTILAFVIALPVALLFYMPEAMAEPLMWAVLAGVALFFGGGGYLMLVRPYNIYKKLPEIQAQTDGTNLYIYGKKEAVIPLRNMEGFSCFASPENLLIQMLADGYGVVTLEVPEYGKFKFYHVSHANQVPDKLVKVCRR